MRPLPFRQFLLTCALSLGIAPAYAEWSATITGATDYLFNGVSQTGHKPAIQGSLDWAAPNGIYASLWASNVDFDDGANVEVDGYLGYAAELPVGLNLDAGLAYYSYHGASHSKDLSYPELYAKFGAGLPRDAMLWLKLWYTNNYAGLNTDHNVVMIEAEVPITERWSLQAQVDRSTSFDLDRFAWDQGRDHYYHWQLMAQTELAGFDISFGYSDTDLSFDAGDATALLTVGHSFSF